MPSTIPAVRFREAGLLAAVLLLTSGCELFRRSVRRDAPPPKLNCPHYYSRFVNERGEGYIQRDSTHDTVAVALSGTLAEVPEYNDCQRMLPERGNNYGALATVFASERLEQLLQDQAAATSQAGSFRAVAAASVFGIDDGYEPLGFQEDMNCLYLWKAGTRWAARMVPIAGIGGACLTPLDTTRDIGETLAVVVEPLPAGAGLRFPPVARWDWSPATNHQYIGIKCGPDWCHVGPRGFSPSPQPSADLPALVSWLPSLPNAAAGADAAALQRVSLRGWYDDQRLAPATGGAGLVSDLWAAVLPHPAIDTLSDPNAFRARWRVTAFVWIPTPSAGSGAAQALGGYLNRFNYHAGWNAISLCDGTSAECGIATPHPPCHPPTAEPGETFLHGRVEAPGVQPRYFCVRRRGHAGAAHVVGTARWRWSDNDETLWARCVQGCCELEN